MSKMPSIQYTGGSGSSSVSTKKLECQTTTTKAISYSDTTNDLLLDMVKMRALHRKSLETYLW